MSRRNRTRLTSGGILGLLVAVALLALPAQSIHGAPAPADAATSGPAAAGPAATVLADAGQEAGQGEPGQEQQQEDHAEEGAAGHGEGPDLPRIFLVLIAILLSAKLLGEAAERIDQPAVLGELIAGVILGGSVLGVIPAQGTPIGEIVHVLAEIGVAILLFEIGLETDLKEMFRVGPSATGVALVGVLLPFGLGFLYWYYFDPQIGVHPAGIDFWIVAIFIGATLTATSVGITARVLSDLGKMHTSEARIIIGAAVIDDVLGIVILAIVASLAAGAAVTFLGVSKIFLLAFGFLVVAVIVGNWAAPYLFDLVDKMRVRGVLLVTAFSFALLLAALADLSGSAMIIGAFAAGIVLSSTNQFDTVVDRIEPVADIFTPIFFVWVGAPVNVQLLIPGTPDFDANVLLVGGILTAIAIVSKVLAGYAVRQDGVHKLAVGVGMVPRGEVGLIFAAIGLQTGVLSNAVYSSVLIMVMLSTFVVPPYLKVLLEGRGETPPPSDEPPHEGVPATEGAEGTAGG